MNEMPSGTLSSEADAEHVDFIWNSIKRIGNCMLIAGDGAHLRGRPMRALPSRDENLIHFITAKSSHKLEEFVRDPSACLCFTEGAHTFVSTSGTNVHRDDRAKIRELWSEGDDAYFPHGPSDPNAVLLVYTPETGEYWDAPSNPVLIAIEFIKAQVTGQQPSLRDNAKVTLS